MTMRKTRFAPLSHPRIRNYSAYPNADRWNPLSIANRILPTLPPFPPSPFAVLSLRGADQIFSFTRNGIDLTRETELTRFRMNFVRAAKFSRADIFEIRRLFDPSQNDASIRQLLFISRILHTKRYVIN